MMADDPLDSYMDSIKKKIIVEQSILLAMKRCA